MSHRTSAWFCLMAVCWLTLPVSAAEAEHPFGLNENHPYGIISNAYETPHVKWAKPYAGGTIKALVWRR